MAAGCTQPGNEEPATRPAIDNERSIDPAARATAWRNRERRIRFATIGIGRLAGATDARDDATILGSALGRAAGRDGAIPSEHLDRYALGSDAFRQTFPTERTLEGVVGSPAYGEWRETVAGLLAGY